MRSLWYLILSGLLLAAISWWLQDILWSSLAEAGSVLIGLVLCKKIAHGFDTSDLN
ncbi:hypothetical protein [Flavobacterium sp.]|uniref:hypothetical protein n=1 Tax=Flavobacterium sp. TaxID=239 RepID=UPI0022C23551|nr:hypothetical protein [Flavobacterium sp.]MCZ8145742.1 hypothetical protein [Flavobacterium sp.]